MKNIIKISFLFTLTLISFSCDKSNQLVSTNEIDYAKIGSEHNRLINDILTEKNSSSLTIGEIYDMVLDNIDDPDIKSNPPLTKEECVTLMKKYDNFSYEKLDSLVLDGLISIKQKSYIDETHEVLNSPLIFEEKLTELELMHHYIETDENLTDTDREVLLTFIEVAKSSHILWHENFDPMKDDRFDFAGTILADAIGAGAGALAGGFWGALFWGTIASLGYAAQSTSAITVIY